MMAGHLVLLKNQQFRLVLRTILDNSDCTDLVLIADDEKWVKCHQAYLAAASPFFKAILESHPRALRDVCISVPGVSYRDLKMAIDLLYNGEVYVSRERGSCIAKLLESLGFPYFSENHDELSDTSTIDILSDEFESDAPTPSKRPRQEETRVRSTIGPKNQVKEQPKENKEGKDGIYCESSDGGGSTRSGQKETFHIQDHRSDNAVRASIAGLRHSDKRGHGWQTRVESKVNDSSPGSGRSTRSSKGESHSRPGSGDQNANILGVKKLLHRTKEGNGLMGRADNKKLQEFRKVNGTSPNRNKKNRDKSEKEHVGSDFESDVSSVFVVAKERKRRGFKNYITSLDSAAKNEKELTGKLSRKRRVTKEPSKLSKASEDFVFMSPMRSRSKLRESAVHLEEKLKSHNVNTNPKVLIHREDTTKLYRTSKAHKLLPNTLSPVVKLKRLSLEEVQRMTKKLHCDNCDLNFNSYWLSGLHKSTKCEKVVPEQCLLCEFKIENYASYVSHSAMHSMKDHRKCPVCSASDVMDIDIHMFTAGHLPENLKAYECDVCRSKFARSEDHAIHVKEVHRGNSEHLTESTSLSCKHCNTDFLSAEALEDHQSLKPQTCCIAKYFKTGRFGMSRCSICNRLVFGDMNRLRSHLSSHVDKNNVICDDTDKGGRASEDGPICAEVPSAPQVKDNVEMVISKSKKQEPTKQENRQINGIVSMSDMDEALLMAGKVCAYCNTCPSMYNKHVAECSLGVFTVIGEKVAQCKICGAMVHSRYRHNHFRQKHMGMKRSNRKNPSGRGNIMLDQTGVVTDHPFFCFPGKEPNDIPSSVLLECEVRLANPPVSVVIETEEHPIVIVDETATDTGKVVDLEIEEAANRRSSICYNDTYIDATLPSLTSTPGGDVGFVSSSPTFLESDVEYVGSTENWKCHRFLETPRREKKLNSLKSKVFTEGIGVLETDLQEIEEVRDCCEELPVEIIAVTKVSPNKAPSEFVSVICQENMSVEGFSLEDTTEI